MLRAAFFLGMCCLTACASRPWLRAESPHLVVYSEVDELATRDAIASVEGFAAFFQWATQCEPAPARLALYLVDSASELQRTWPDSTNVSCYVAARGETFAVAIHDKSSLEDQTSLFALLHAVAPHFAPRCAPMWVATGVAEYYGETVVEAAGNPYGRFSNSRVDLLHEQSWIELDAFLGATEVVDSDVPIFDAEAWLLMRYLRSDPSRRAKLAGYLEAVRGGQDPIAAMPAAGFELGYLREELERYRAHNVVLNPSYVTTVNGIADGDPDALQAHRAAKKRPPPPIEITHLPTAETENLLEDRAARLGGATVRCEPDRNQL